MMIKHTFFYIASYYYKVFLCTVSSPIIIFKHEKKITCFPTGLIMTQFFKGTVYHKINILQYTYRFC